MFGVIAMLQAIGLVIVALFGLVGRRGERLAHRSDRRAVDRRPRPRVLIDRRRASLLLRGDR
jgi:hypothetical protein